VVQACVGQHAHVLNGCSAIARSIRAAFLIDSEERPTALPASSTAIAE
jgi:hypothetical protein